jgi:hypothetical protein
MTNAPKFEKITIVWRLGESDGGVAYCEQPRKGAWALTREEYVAKVCRTCLIVPENGQDMEILAVLSGHPNLIA